MSLFSTAIRLSIGSLALASLTACGSDSGSDDGVIDIAAIMPMTGPAAIYGESTVAMMELVIDEVNKGGGITVGGEEYTLDLEVFDDGMNPETAQALARDALSDGYELIVGPFGSGTASAVQPLMAQGTALWHLNVATVDGPTKNPNVFRTSAKVSAFLDPALAFIEANPDIQRVALLTDQTHTAHLSSTEALIDGIEELGREVVLDQQYQGGDTDFRAPISNMLAEDVDLYIVRGYSTESVLVLEQTRELGGDTPMMWNAGQTAGETRALVDDLSLLQDVYQSAPLTSLDPFAADGNELALSLQEKIGDKAGAASAYAHDGMQILIAALTNASEPTAEAVQEAMAELTADELAGKTLNEYLPQADGLLFEDREVDLDGAVVVWDDKSGWTRVE